MYPCFQREISGCEQIESGHYSHNDAPRGRMADLLSLLGHCKFKRQERGAAVNSSCILVLPFYRSDDCGLALHQRKREKPVEAQLGRALARVKGGSI
jgi:hypothetical protein